MGNPTYRHPRFSLPWLREVALGIFLGLLAVQLGSGTAVAAFIGLSPSQHRLLGLSIVLLLPTLLFMHPMPPPGRVPPKACDPLYPPMKLLGILSLFILVIMGISGLILHNGWLLELGSRFPLGIVHRALARLLALLLAVHLVLAVRLRRLRWNRRLLENPGHAPRYRAGWWPATLATIAAAAFLL